MTTVVLNTVTRKVEVFSSARDVLARAEIADHKAAADPHPQYLGGAEAADIALSGDAGDLIAGTVPDARMPSWTGYNLASRSALQAAAVPVTVVGLRLLGHAAAGDGGSALYRRAASEPAHAGKIQSNDGAWWEIAEKTLNVLQFGARGDGTTDDAAAIQNALNVASALGLSAVHFPPGTYSVDTKLQVPANAGLIGVPKRTKIIPGANLASSSYLLESAVTSGTTDELYNGRIVLYGIEFDNLDRALHASVNAGLVRLVNCTPHVEHCIFHNTRWIALSIGGSRRALVENCEFHDGGNRHDTMPTTNNPPAIWCGQNSADGSTTRQPTIRHCHFHDWTWSAIYAFQSGGRIENNLFENVYEAAIWGEDNGDIEEWIIAGNKISGVRFNSVQAAGIEVQGGSRIVIRDNIVDDCDISGIWASFAKDIWIVNNIVRNCLTAAGIGGTGTSQWGQIHLRSSASWNAPDSINIIANRVVDDRGTPVAEHGIRVRWASPAPQYQALALIDNDVRGGGTTSGITIDDGALADNFVMRGNRGWADIRNAPALWGGEASHTGDTAETTLATVTIPGGAMGAHGALRITMLWDRAPGGSLAAVLRVRLGSAAFYEVNMTTDMQSLQSNLVIQNAGSESVQVSQRFADVDGWGDSSFAVAENGIVTTAERDLSLTVQLNDAADTVALRSYRVELLRS